MIELLFPITLITITMLWLIWTDHDTPTHTPKDTLKDLEAYYSGWHK